jgi:hypothetical protein
MWWFIFGEEEDQGLRRKGKLKNDRITELEVFS